MPIVLRILVALQEFPVHALYSSRAEEAIFGANRGPILRPDGVARVDVAYYWTWRLDCLDPRILVVIDELELLLLILAEFEGLAVFLHSAYLRLVLLDEVLSLLELGGLGILAQFHRVLELRQVLNTRGLIKWIAILMLEQLLRGG